MLPCHGRGCPQALTRRYLQDRFPATAYIQLSPDKTCSDIFTHAHTQGSFWIPCSRSFALPLPGRPGLSLPRHVPPHTSSPDFPHLPLLPQPRHQPRLAAPEQPLEVQQGHTSHLPPSQPCLLCSSGSDTVLLLPVLNRRSEVQGRLQIFAFLWLSGLAAVLCTQQASRSARLHRLLACCFPPSLPLPSPMH